ncbi:MAG: hypothetical protein WBC59_02705 [Phycisphaerae bacterium]
MRRIRMWGWVFAAAWVLVAGGCWPNRVAVSPDGRTMYFSLNKEGGIKTEESSNIYALDVETAELRQLTDSPAMEGWCVLSEDGKHLLHSAAAEDRFWIEALNLEKESSTPLTGAPSIYLYPRLVCGKHVLVVEVEDFKNSEGRWVLIGQEGSVPLPLPDGYEAAPGEVAVAEHYFACAVKRKVSEPASEDAGENEDKGSEDNKDKKDNKDREDQWEVLVYVIVPGPVEPKESDNANEPQSGHVKTIQVAQWLVDDVAPVDLAFSPGGKRLVAAVFGAGASDEHTGFFELDPAGEAEPKPLFEAKKAFYPQWTPDGLGLVYLRLCPEDDKWREVMLWRAEAAERQILARLPGKMGEAYTTWRWLEDGRLRIYHLSDEGVRIVDAKPDGSEAAAKRLPRENLRVLKRLADFERAMEKVPDLSEGQWPPAFAKKMKIVADYQDKHIENAPESVQKAFEEVVEAATRWEPVPAIPELPKEEAEPEPSAEKVKAVAEPLKQTFGSLEDPFKQAVEGAGVWESVPAVPAIAPANASATRNMSAR